uniref:Radical SAM domain-containing protein n=1 Tax=uncultured organism TaxID=155900 RepID=M1P1Z5_9ZZZZ|nr:radical SAM domain-containing protein [uncultured organism]
MTIIRKLKRKNAENLFREARKISTSKKLKFSYTNVISKKCLIDPVCKHCEWISDNYFNENSSEITPLEKFLDFSDKAERIGVDRIVVPSGWQGYNIPDYFYDYLQELLDVTEIDVWGAFGAVGEKVLEKLSDIGLSGYSCGLETTNEEVFSEVRPGDDMKARIETLRYAKEIDLKTSSSLVLGMGEKVEDRADTIRLMRDLRIDSAGVWPFCPSPYTEMEKWEHPNSYVFAKTLATLVTELEDTDIVGDTRPKNLKWSIRAGSNVFSIRDRDSIERIEQMRKNLIEKDSSRAN